MAYSTNSTGGHPHRGPAGIIWERRVCILRCLDTGRAVTTGCRHSVAIMGVVAWRIYNILLY